MRVETLRGSKAYISAPGFETMHEGLSGSTKSTTQALPFILIGESKYNTVLYCTLLRDDTVSSIRAVPLMCSLDMIH